MCGFSELQRNQPSNVLAVLDHIGGGGLGDLTLGIPGHVLAGETGELQGGHGTDQSVTDLLVAHVGGAAGGFQSGLDDVHAVISVGGELVGLSAVGGDISVHEALVALNRGGEGSHEHQTLGQRNVEAGHGQDAVHAVHTEEGGGVVHGRWPGADDGGVADSRWGGR